MKVNIPQITLDKQRLPVCLSDGEKKDLRIIINAVLAGNKPRVRYGRLIALKGRLAK